MLSNNTDVAQKIDHKRLSYRLPIALLLTAFFFVWAAARPLDVGHDTALYAEVVNAYFFQDDVRFPDVLFNAIATAIAAVFDQIPGGKEYSVRFFFVFIALIESVLMVRILREKKYILESVLLAIGYGPLIFLDIIRQGVSMLLAGVFFSGRRRQPIYIIGAFSTHIVSAVALLSIPIKKKNLVTYAILMVVFCILAVLVIDGLAARFEYYSRTAGYFGDIDSIVFSWDVFSAGNILVVLFFFYSAAVGGFTKLESFILFILYLVSIYIPLLYRIYLFYFFCLSCSKDVLINSKKIKYIIFNVLYAIVLLRFSLNAFFTFGGG